MLHVYVSACVYPPEGMLSFWYGFLSVRDAVLLASLTFLKNVMKPVLNDT